MNQCELVRKASEGTFTSVARALPMGLHSEEEYKKMKRLIDRMSDGGISILPKEPPTL
jgi:hypothetical protein